MFSGYITRKSLSFYPNFPIISKLNLEEINNVCPSNLDFVTIQNNRRNIHTLYLTLPIQRVFYKKRKKRNILVFLKFLRDLMG